LIAFVHEGKGFASRGSRFDPGPLHLVTRTPPKSLVGGIFVLKDCVLSTCHVVTTGTEQKYGGSYVPRFNLPTAEKDMAEGTNHIPQFTYGRYVVEAWGHRVQTGTGAAEMVWSIRVDDVFLGSFVAPVDAAESEILKRTKHWVSQNLPK
jgi:hypothetical protein